MVHIGIAFVVLALTFVAMSAFSLLFPPTVSTSFAVGSGLALAISSVFLAYVVRHRM